jgi:hypothetical protein
LAGSPAPDIATAPAANPATTSRLFSVMQLSCV